MMKQLLTILTNRNFEEIDYFEAVFSPKIVTKTRHFDCKQFLISRRSTRVVVMGLGTSFVLTLISIGRKALPFQRMAVVDKKLH